MIATLGRLFAVVGLVVGLASQELATSFVQFGEGEYAETGTVELVDLDGDGREDLLLGIALADGAGRELRIHRRRSGSQPAFDGGADRVLTIDRKAVAFAVADVLPSEGVELVLFFPNVVVACPALADGEPKYSKVADCRFLWQPAYDYALYSWQSGVVDIDGDGAMDLVVPENDGYRLLMRRGEQFESRELAVPPLRRVRKRDELAAIAGRRAAGGGFELNLPGGGAQRPGNVLAVVDAVPSPHWHDVNGDGMRDLLAMRGADVHVWLQTEAGFDPEPSFTRELPKRLDQLIDPAFKVAARDVDADRSVDLMISSSRVDDGDQLTYLEVFRSRRSTEDAAGSWFRPPVGRPDQRLRFPGLVGLSRYDDVDGDGRLDLVIGRLRTDLLGSLANGGRGMLDARVSVFLGQEQGFAEPAALVHDIRFRAEELGSQRFDSLSFLADVNGDRVRDFVLRTGAESIAIYAVTRSADGLAVGDALFEKAVHADARLMPSRTGQPLLGVLEPEQLVLFTWGDR